MINTNDRKQNQMLQQERPMTKIVDARGLACPQPVILTKKALTEVGQEPVTAIVDSPTAEANVSRMAQKAGWQVAVEAQDDGTYLHLSRERTAAESLSLGKAEVLPATDPLVVFISSDRMGRGIDELGDILMRAFLHTLNEVAPLPDTLVFVNTGVRLLVEGSPVLEDLQTLADQGVDVLACGTCLNYLELTDKVAIGTVSNMYDIAETLLGAGKVVTP
jgi:selenium metabolism protein YedF